MDITQPIIHDRHIVKQAFEQMKEAGEIKFEHPKDLTIVTCRNEGTLEDRIIPHLSGYEDTSILERNMEYLGLDLVVLRDGRLPMVTVVCQKLRSGWKQSMCQEDI